MILRSAACLLAAALLAIPQSVTLIENLESAEASYLDAQNAFLKADPNLERDLYVGKRDEAKVRIHRAAGLRDDMMAKKAVYLGLLVQRSRELSSRLASAKATNIPTSELKSDLEREQTRLLSQQDALESRLHNLPESDEYLLVRRAMEDERNTLISMQNSVAMRIRSLDKVAASQSSSQAQSQDGLEDKLAELTKIWEDERAAVVRQREKWDRYYRLLEKSLNQPADGAQIEGFQGAWKSRAMVSSTPSAFSLEVSRKGKKKIVGYYVLPPNPPGTVPVRVSFVGELKSETEATAQWRSRAPSASGTMTLKVRQDGTLLINRETSNNPAAVPLGTELLERR